MAKYIYHLKPNPFEGSCLLPLNLMEKESEIYQRNLKKYNGREELMEQIIPILNCKWNDVIQFSALDPKIILTKLNEIYPQKIKTQIEYFKIPIDEVINKYPTVAFTRKPNSPKGKFTIELDEVCSLTQENYQELTEVPTQTISYWERMKETNQIPLWFPYVTHVFVQGSLPTKGFLIQTM